LPKFDDQNIDLPFGVPVQKGIVDNFTGLEKFGYNPSVGTSFETVWSGSSIYTYPTSATTAVATSSDTVSDNGSTIRVFGLDQNYDLIDEIITVGGSASTNTFLRVFRAFVLSANTGTSNVGTITITVNSISVAIIDAGYGQTLMALYTIPRNRKGYLLSLNGSPSKTQETEFMFVVRANGSSNSFNVKSYITTAGNYVNRQYNIPDVIPEKSDIELRAKASATESVSGGFELLLEDITYSG